MTPDDASELAECLLACRDQAVALGFRPWCFCPLGALLDPDEPGTPWPADRVDSLWLHGLSLPEARGIMLGFDGWREPDVNSDDLVPYDPETFAVGRLLKAQWCP